MAKVTSKGQITIPVSIRKRLSIREGDKVLFLDTADGVMMVNPDVRPAEASAEGASADDLREQSASYAKDVTDEPISPVQQPQDAVKSSASGYAPESEKRPLLENQYDVNKLLDEIRSFREKY